MSEAEETERLKKDLEKCNSIIKVSVAAQDLIDFTKSRQDPFNPEHPPAENPWIGGKGKGRSPGRTEWRAERHTAKGGQHPKGQSACHSGAARCAGQTAQHVSRHRCSRQARRGGRGGGGGW